MISVIYTQCHKLYHSVESHYAENHYAECRYAECHFADCRGGIKYFLKKFDKFYLLVKVFAGITTLSIMTFSITTLNIMTFSIINLRKFTC